jgi:hypothetical protein
MERKKESKQLLHQRRGEQRNEDRDGEGVNGNSGCCPWEDARGGATLSRRRRAEWGRSTSTVERVERRRELREADGWGRRGIEDAVDALEKCGADNLQGAKAR